MPLLAAWLLAHAIQEPNRLKIFFDGSPAGESVTTMVAGGAQRSVTHLTIGTIKIDSTVEVWVDQGKITSYSADVLQDKSHLKLDYRPGELSVDGAAGRKTLRYTIPGRYGASLHPALSAEFLRSELPKLENGREDKTTLYLFDVGSEVPCRLQMLPSGLVRIGKQDVGIRRVLIAIGPTEVEYDLDPDGQVVAMDVPSQKLRFIAPGYGSLFDDDPSKHPELSQPVYRTEIVRGLKMRARDRVELVSDLVKPAEAGRFPVILQRTPYGRETAIPLGDYWAKRGYVFVAQDCRGRGDSGGSWDPFVREGKDGADTIAWLARQPWCDGNVGMIGGSYAGTVQWQAAIEKPAALKCIVPQVSTPDAMHNLPYEYGTFFLYGSLWWSKIVDGKKADLRSARKPLANPKGLTKLPLSLVDKAVLGKTNSIYQRWLRRTTIGDWAGFDQLSKMADAQVPALQISGWYDGDGIGTKLNWEAMRRSGRKDQWLVYGPWTHAFNTTTRLGDLDFGPGSRYDLDTLTLRFFDTYLKGKDAGMSGVPKVQAFVTGANKWVSLDGWPASDSTLVTRFLTPGKLVGEPGLSGTAAYTYDPSKDLDADLNERAENIGKVKLPPKGTYVLFQGEPLAKAEAIAGPFEVRLYFRSSAQDTDLFATLLDVAPDGTMRPIGQPGKLRASYRSSLDKPKPLEQDETYAVLLRPWDAAHELGPKHRLALLVNSSLFPIYARNLGTMDPISTAVKSAVQKNVILTGRVTPSRITYRRLW